MNNEKIVIEGYEYEGIENIATAFMQELQKRCTKNQIDDSSDVQELEEELMDEIRDYHDMSDGEFSAIWVQVVDYIGTFLPGVELAEV